MQTPASFAVSSGYGPEYGPGRVSVQPTAPVQATPASQHTYWSAQYAQQQQPSAGVYPQQNLVNATQQNPTTNLNWSSWGSSSTALTSQAQAYSHPSWQRPGSAMPDPQSAWGQAGGSNSGSMELVNGIRDILSSFLSCYSGANMEQPLHQAYAAASQGHALSQLPAAANSYAGAAPAGAFVQGMAQAQMAPQYPGTTFMQELNSYRPTMQLALTELMSAFQPAQQQQLRQALIHVLQQMGYQFPHGVLAEQADQLHQWPDYMHGPAAPQGMPQQTTLESLFLQLQHLFKPGGGVTSQNVPFPVQQQSYQGYGAPQANPGQFPAAPTGDYADPSAACATLMQRLMELLGKQSGAAAAVATGGVQQSVGHVGASEGSTLPRNPFSGRAEMSNASHAQQQDAVVIPLLNYFLVNFATDVGRSGEGKM
jgi:hypothetical protein